MNSRKSLIITIAVFAAALSGWFTWRRMIATNVGEVTGPAVQSRDVSRPSATERLRAGQPALQAAVQTAAQDGWCTLEQSTLLNEAVLDRMQFTLEPSFDTWQNIAKHFGAKISKHPVHDDQEISPAQFDEASAMLAAATYDFAKGELRALARPGQAPLDMQSLGSFGRALFRTSFPRPSEMTSATILEWLVPAEITQADGTRAKVKVGFSFWWQRGESAGGGAGGGRWVPFDVTVYLPPGSVRLKGHVL